MLQAILLYICKSLKLQLRPMPLNVPTLVVFHILISPEPTYLGVIHLGALYDPFLSYFPSHLTYARTHK